MNRYGHKFGVHTPQLSEKIFRIINQANPTLKWSDWSYHNDVVDSIGMTIQNNQIEILFPNVDDYSDNTYTEGDQEEFKYFVVIDENSPNRMLDFGTDTYEFSIDDLCKLLTDEIPSHINNY